MVRDNGEAHENNVTPPLAMKIASSLTDMPLFDKAHLHIQTKNNKYQKIHI